MDNDSRKSRELLQLKQVNIHLKSEVTKYKSIVDKMKDNDYYTLVLRVERENVRLKSEKKELLKTLYYMQKELRQTQEQAKQVNQHHENQRQKKISSIELLLADKNYLQNKNNQLVKKVKKMRGELKVYRQAWLKPNEANYTDFIQRVERILTEHMQETTKQVSYVVDRSQNIIEEISRLNSERNYLVEEIEEKKIEIEKLKDQLISLQEMSSRLNASSSHTVREPYAKNYKILDYLDTQVKKILEQSLIFEEQYEEKLRILQHLEQQLHMLSYEIEGY